MNRSLPDHASLSSTSPVGIVRRLAVAGYLGGVVGCSVLVFLAAGESSAECLVAAVATGAVVLTLRGYLRNCAGGGAALSATAAAGFGEDLSLSEQDSVATKAGQLADGLMRWSELEKARGTARFDAWDLQSTRTELRELLREDAELRRLLGLGR